LILKRKSGCWLLVAGCWLGVSPILMVAQDATPAQETVPAPKGKVLFERKTDELSPDVQPQETKAAAKTVEGDATDPAFAVSDAERGALTFVAYDLDAHLVPAKSEMVMHARFSVRNDGKEPLTKLAVQVSSSLKWERFVLAGGAVALPFVQRAINTDADHTGGAQEAIVTLPQPLAVGATVEVSAFYAGTLGQSSGRLERIGAPADEALRADWDKVAADGTALRGFGNVLWYPVASVPVFLGDGAKLFQAVGLTKLRQQGATIKLRLTIEYAGDAPQVAYFCGRREPLTVVTENVNALAESAPGVASAEWTAQRLGFRVPSLFVPDGVLKRTDSASLSTLTDDEEAVRRYAFAETEVQPLLMEWLGEALRQPLTVIDHEGQPFEDRALLVAPMKNADPKAIAGVLSHSLSHAWFGSSQQWLDEGVAQLMGWLWVEKTRGREVAMDLIRDQVTPLALAEPSGVKDESGGQSLVEAHDEVYYRTKAATVLWMLRSVAGDGALAQALKTYRKDRQQEDAKEFQRVLEDASHKDLKWFFDDWVYRDKGLPDLSIGTVNARELMAKDGRGGYLVAVEVKNDGDAVAEVPVTVRSGTLTATERVRVAGKSSVSTRILFEGNPAEVVLNDGSVPEVGASLHVKQVVLAAKP